MNEHGKIFRRKWQQTEKSQKQLLFFAKRLDRFRQRIFLIRRMEIEINSAERALLAAFAQNDRDLFVERNAMAHSRPAIFVSGDGFV